MDSITGHRSLQLLSFMDSHYLMVAHTNCSANNPADNTTLPSSSRKWLVLLLHIIYIYLTCSYCYDHASIACNVLDSHKCSLLLNQPSYGLSRGDNESMGSFIWYKLHETPSFFNKNVSNHVYNYELQKLWQSHALAFSLSTKPNNFLRKGLIQKEISPKQLIKLVLFMSGQVELNPGQG